VLVEQWPVLISPPVYRPVSVEQRPVPISVSVHWAVPAERQSVPEEFGAHTAHAQMPEEQQTVAEQQSLAVSAHPLEPSAATNISFCEPRKPDQRHV
jgi:hypothetical protein